MLMIWHESCISRAHIFRCPMPAPAAADDTVDVVSCVLAADAFCSCRDNCFTMGHRASHGTNWCMVLQMWQVRRLSNADCKMVLEDI
jgi:hypothetical protein